MSYKLSLSAFLTLALSSTSALALTCANDYGGSDGCALNVTAAGDCETLGYATGDVEGCEHYLFCPFNPDYKRCVAKSTKSCTELGFTTDDKSSWCGQLITCTDNNTYTACVGKKQCPKSNAQLLTECGTSGAKGWKLNNSLFDANNCPTQCVAKDCPAVSISTGSGSGSGETVQSTTDSNAENCGTTGTSGWSTRVTAYYSGDKKCYVCEAKSCPSGYKVIFSEKSCGSSGSKGWTIEYSGSAAGNNLCGKCVAKDCSSGKDEMSYGYSHPYLTFTPNGEYTGNLQCGTFEFNKTEYCNDIYADVKRSCGDSIGYCKDNLSSSGCRDYKACVYAVEANYESGYTDFTSGNACQTCMDWISSTAEYNGTVCPEFW